MTDYEDRQQRWSWVFAVGYLVFLAFPLYADVVTRRPPSAIAIAVLGVSVFVVLYLWYWARRPFQGGARESVPVLVAMSAVATALTAYDAQWAWIFIYCTVGVGALGTTWWRTGVAVLALVAVLVAVSAATREATIELLYIVLVMVLATLGIVGSRRMVEHNRQLRQAREEIARLAVAEERLRFARDLHDLLGHSLSVIVLKSELAGRLAPSTPERAAQEVRDVERVAREALREVREAVAGYRQPSLGQELESAAVTLAAAGVAAHVEPLAGPLPTPVDATLAWAVREGVTNVIRHSRARTATIRLARQEYRVELELVDDGVGCDGCSAGNGLRGVRERVAARDGTVSFGPGADGGFRLRIDLPLNEVPRTAAAT